MLFKDDKTCQLTLKWLISLTHNKNESENREALGVKYPLKKIVIAEGITEEILLPKFAKINEHNFDKSGIHNLRWRQKSSRKIVTNTQTLLKYRYLYWVTMHKENYTEAPKIEVEKVWRWVDRAKAAINVELIAGEFLAEKAGGDQLE